MLKNRVVLDTVMKFGRRKFTKRIWRRVWIGMLVARLTRALGTRICRIRCLVKWLLSSNRGLNRLNIWWLFVLTMVVKRWRRLFRV